MSKRKDKENREPRRMSATERTTECTPLGDLTVTKTDDGRMLCVVTGAYAQMLHQQQREFMLRRAMTPKCYISGAIAHHDLQERMAAFEQAAAALKFQGFVPVNPFNNGVAQSEHWTEHMRADIGLLLGCDYIYMLKGWELSKGCKLELDVATSCGIKVLFE